MGSDKRGSERVVLDVHVRGEVMVFQPMTILDISPGGAQIHTEFALQVDSLRDFRLSLGDRAVIVKGRVAYCHVGELTEATALYRSGVAFVELSPHTAEAIAEFVSARSRAGSPPAAARNPA